MVPLSNEYASDLIKITSIMLNKKNYIHLNNHCCSHKKYFSSKTGYIEENHIGSRTWYTYSSNLKKKIKIPFNLSLIILSIKQLLKHFISTDSEGRNSVKPMKIFYKWSVS